MTDPGQRFYRNQLLKVECACKLEGCNWKGTYEQRINHESKCPKVQSSSNPWNPFPNIMRWRSCSRSDLLLENDHVQFKKIKWFINDKGEIDRCIFYIFDLLKIIQNCIHIGFWWFWCHSIPLEKGFKMAPKSSKPDGYRSIPNMKVS